MTDALVASKAAAILAADAGAADGFKETAIAAFEVQRGFVERAAAMPYAEAARLVMIARHAPHAPGFADKPDLMVDALLLALTAALVEKHSVIAELRGSLEPRVARSA